MYHVYIWIIYIYIHSDNNSYASHYLVEISLYYCRNTSIFIEQIYDRYFGVNPLTKNWGQNIVKWMDVTEAYSLTINTELRAKDTQF